MTVVVMGFYFSAAGTVAVTDFFKFCELIGGIYVMGNVASSIVSK
jgi:hypothetical protein